MILVIKMLTLAVALYGILEPIGGGMPTQKEIWTYLQDPVCQVELGFWKPRYIKYGIYDPIWAPQDEKHGKYTIGPPWDLPQRILKGMSFCQRMDLLRSMLQGGLLWPEKWTQPEIPPPSQKCQLEPLYMRLSNVHAGGSVEINRVHAFGVQEGNVPINHVADMYIYRPGAPGGDTGWVDVRQWMKPGNNEVDPIVQNVRIPSGFLNLDTTPSPLSMKVEFKTTANSMIPLSSFTWLDLQPYTPSSVGHTRLIGGSFHLNVICDDGKLYVPQPWGPTPSVAMALPGRQPVDPPPSTTDTQLEPSDPYVAECQAAFAQMHSGGIPPAKYDPYNEVHWKQQGDFIARGAYWISYCAAVPREKLFSQNGG